MRFLLIKLFIPLCLLSACVSSPSPQQEKHPFAVETKEIELLARRATSLGNYRHAIQLYSDAYNNYSAIDDQDAMHKELINIAQTALLIEDLDTVKQVLKLSTALEQSEKYKPRLSLLKANLAIAEQQWQQAISLLDSLAMSDNISFNESVLVSNAIAKFGAGNSRLSLDSIKESLSIASSEARLARLIAEQALVNGDLSNANLELGIALELYRELAFQPGIAECLILQAKIHQLEFREASAEILRQRAKNLWLKLDNKRAIERHQL